MRYALYYFFTGLNVETTRCSYCHSANIKTNLFAFGHVGAYHIAGLKSLNPLFPCQVSTRKPKRTQARALITATTSCLNNQRWLLPIRAYPMLVYSCRLQSMGLRKRPKVRLLLRYNVVRYTGLRLVNRASYCSSKPWPKGRGS